MRALKTLIASLAFISPIAVWAGDELVGEDTDSDFDQALEEAVASKEALAEVQMMERPRLYRGPYSADYLETMHYRPFGMYRGYGAWGHGFYPSYLVPGKNSVWFAVGSDGYMGTGFTTSQYYPEQGITLALSASWEQGELFWFPGMDYEAYTISPRLHWTNGDTSFWLGLDYSDVKYSGDVQRQRPRLATPYVTRASESADESWAVEADSLKEFSAGVRHSFGDIMDVDVSYRQGKSRF